MPITTQQIFEYGYQDVFHHLDNPNQTAHSPADVWHTLDSQEYRLVMRHLVVLYILLIVEVILHRSLMDTSCLVANNAPM